MSRGGLRSARRKPASRSRDVGEDGNPARRRRLFIAAECPEAFASLFASLRGALDVPRARWSRPEAVHLTFKFLGATDPSRLEAIGSTVARVASSHAPFALRTGSPGLFGSPRRPRVLWTALEGNLTAAESLARDLEASMSALGFEREKRPFRPHLTLARFDADRGVEIHAPALARFDALGGIEVPVDALVLFESLPGPGGSRYVPRGRFPLEGEGT